MTEIACYFRREDWIVYRYRLNASFENTRRLCKFLYIEYSKRSGRVRLSLLLASFPNKSTITTRIQRWLCYYNAWNSKRRLPPPTSSQACSFTRALFRSLVRSPPGKERKRLLRRLFSRNIKSCHLAAARRVKLWSLNANLFFGESLD